MDKNINPAVQQAIKIVGSQGKLAAATGYGQSTVYKWLTCQLKVPAEIVPDIVELTGGRVQAHILRPDAPKLFPPPG